MESLACLPIALRVWRLDQLPPDMPRWIEPAMLGCDCAYHCWLREDALTARHGVLALMLMVVRKSDGYHVHVDSQTPYYDWAAGTLSDVYSLPVTEIHEGLPS